MADNSQFQQSGSTEVELRIKAAFEVRYNRLKTESESTGSTRSGGASIGHVSESTTVEESNGIFTGNSFGRSAAKRFETKSEFPDSRKIYGFENEILSLKNFLLNQKDFEEFKTLAVVGTYGVGKTALCQNIFKDNDVKDTYVPRLWVSMYTTEDLEDKNRKISAVESILEHIGVEKEMIERIKEDAGNENGVEIKDEDGEVKGEEEQLSRLLYELYLNLWGKKYLIVLDDVREEDGWKERLDEDTVQEGKAWGKHLSCGFPKGSGGRVIITSRDEKLAKMLVGDEHNLHRLYPLSDPESVWKIYEAAFKEKNDAEVDPRNERKYRIDLMNKSCGIPLAARMLGKNKPVEIIRETSP